MENIDRLNEKTKLVTVIIPVFNSEKYMDQCLASICGQTFKNLEIILVYDSSADNTLQKCEWWKEKDNRIRIIQNSKRGGLGAARNQGLNNALGEYIIYADSDDWMEKDYIRVLYEEIEKKHVNYVSSNSIYAFFQADGHKELLTSTAAGSYNTKELLNMLLLCDFPSVWKKMINKKWLLEQKLYQPEVFSYEDWGYAPIFILHAAGAVLLEEPGCYYRINDSNLSNMLSQRRIWEDFIRTSSFFIDRLKQENIFEENIELLRRYALKEFYYRKGISDCKDEIVQQKIREFENEIFIKKMGLDINRNKKKAIILGSFSARWEVQDSYLFGKSIEHYCFSSLIAAMTDAAAVDEIRHENGFRQYQVKQDVSGRLKKDLSEQQEAVYLFIDFLEERHGVIGLEDGNYITGSEAAAEAGIGDGGRKIEIGSLEFWELWEKKCNEFIGILKKNQKIESVILIKNRLALKTGNFEEKKDNGISGLEKVNSIIAKMEKYFLENYNQVQCVEIPSYMQFTDPKFRYGREPQYMNQTAYTAAGFEIFKKCRTII